MAAAVSSVSIRYWLLRGENTFNRRGITSRRPLVYLPINLSAYYQRALCAEMFVKHMRDQYRQSYILAECGKFIAANYPPSG